MPHNMLGDRFRSPTLAATPPPWLRKALMKGKERALNFEDEGVGHG
jgi:nitrogen fixation protein NifX